MVFATGFFVTSRVLLSPLGQMVALVSVLEAKVKDAGTAKNDSKQVETRSHSMIRCHPEQHCSLRGLSFHWSTTSSSQTYLFRHGKAF